MLMLRQKNVQQLRSLIAELTVGRGVMKRRRVELRSATRTLLVIISIQLISNLANILLTLFEYFDGRRLKRQHRNFYRLASDAASLLTVIGNAIRFPVYMLSDPDIRRELVALIICDNHDDTIKKRQSTTTYDTSTLAIANSIGVVVDRRTRIVPYETETNENVECECINDKTYHDECLMQSKQNDANARLSMIGIEVRGDSEYLI